ncbi:MAG: hypothetical protein CTY20_05345 [Hyphomicrobium sp.]|nr:MAG: hypothetical protein CTY20_05345 [Hyphomicrobium sp.]
MTLDEIIHELRTSTGVPNEALRAGVTKVEILRPRIVELARKLIDGVWLIPDDAQLLLRGLHVLAAAKDTQSWPVLRDLLRLPEEDIRQLIGGGAAEGSARLILSLWDGDAAGLMDLAADPEVSWQIRWGLFQALARLACDGRIDRAGVKDLLERVERERLLPDDSIGWVGWVDAVAHLGLTELRPLLEQVWATRSVFSDHRDVDRAETLRILAAAAERPNDPHGLDQDRIMVINDPVEAVEWLERQIAIAFDGVALRSGEDEVAGLGAHDLEWLAGFLDSAQVPETTMSIEMLDGFLTALIAGPDVVKPSDYMGAIWGDEASPVFDAMEQAQFFYDLLMRRWNAIADGLMRGDPVLPIIVDYRDDLVGRDWAYGFLHGLEFHTTLGRSGKEHKRTDRRIDPILALAGPEVYGSGISLSRREKILDDLPDVLLRCAAAWRPSAVPGATSEPVRSAKVGRNDPCPCGSGKKYKKCCGGGGAETVQ